MKRSFFAYILVFSFVFASPTGAFAVSGAGAGRYYLETKNALWRGAMGARHVFTDGFTADLSGAQLGIARLMGLKPVPVKAFNILADTTVSPTSRAVPSQSVGWGIREMLNDAELKQSAGGAGVTIGLLDTGISRAHPDLARRVTGCLDFTDAVRGLVENSCDDQNGHGTHVAGIMVADGGPNGTGAFGFAPQASISVYRVCSADGSCFSDDIAAALTRAANDGAQIIVLGMGGESASSLIQDAITYATKKGVLVFAGAGNDGPYDDSIDWPARGADVVSVAAVDTSEAAAEFSSRGVNRTTTPFVRNEGDVEFAAPGVNIESTYLNGGYAILSGTSMAAPHVAGLAALLWDASVQSPAQVVRAMLRERARDLGETGDDNATGWGMPVAAIR